MKLRGIFLSPDDGGSTPVNNAAENNATAGNVVDNAIAKVNNRSVPKHAEMNANQTESAADRAIARKQANDQAAKKNVKKAKVTSLADLKKLHSDNVDPKDLKTNSVTIDESAADNVQMESGRPEPKNSRKREIPIDTGEVEEPEIEAIESTEEEQPTEEVTQENDGSTQEDKYEPKLKYRAYDEEHDIPELFHSIIKDPESERQVHEIFQKSHAFEKTKAKYEGLEASVKRDLVPEINFYRQVREDLNYFAKSGDIFSLAKKFGLDEKTVLQKAAEYVQLLEAAPEVRAMHEAKIRAEEQNRESARRLAALEQKAIESEMLAKQVAFESILKREDVQSVARSFDERIGTPDAFKKMVAQHAHQIYLNSVQAAQSGQGTVIDLSPEQAVQEFMRAYGLSFQAQSASAATNQTNQTQRKQQTNVATPAPKPRIIPNIASKGQSNIGQKPVFKSVKDIEKYRKERFGR